MSNPAYGRDNLTVDKETWEFLCAFNEHPHLAPIVFRPCVGRDADGNMILDDTLVPVLMSNIMYQEHC